MACHFRAVTCFTVFCILVFFGTGFSQDLDDFLDQTEKDPMSVVTPVTSSSTDNLNPGSSPFSGQDISSPNAPLNFVDLIMIILSHFGFPPSAAPVIVPPGTLPGSGAASNTTPHVATSPAIPASHATASSTPSASGKKPASGTPGLTLETWKGGALSPEKFFQLLGPVARDVFRKTGVPASVTLAQACVETGFGASSIGNARNLFGIKGTGPAGSILVPTKEYINGKWVVINDKFRKYNTWTESVEDHGKFLEQKRYAKCLENKDDPDQFARELQKAGYATAPNYASVLIKRMKQYDLYQWDKLD